MVFAKGHERGLRQVRVQLHLVQHGLDGGVGEQVLERGGVAVAHAQAFYEAQGDERLHRAPRGQERR